MIPVPLVVRDPKNGCCRRIFLLAAYPGEGPLTDPIAGALPWLPELVFMPRTGPRLGLGSIKSNKTAGVRFPIRRDRFTLNFVALAAGAAEDRAIR